MRAINKIIIHCSDTPDNRDIGLDDVREMHKARGFNDIGYHFLIDRQGAIWTGRALELIGAHCEGHNKDSVGICLAGRLDFSTAQITSLVVLCLNATEKFGLHPTDVYCHYEFDMKGKTCPNFSGNMVRNLLMASKIRADNGGYVEGGVP